MNDLALAQIDRLEKKATLAAKTLKSLSNKWRLLILCRLVAGEMSVGELLEVVDLSQSALSQHLAVLRTSGLVTTRRESQSIFYSIKGSEVTIILAALYEAFCAPAAAKKAGRAKKAKA
jgi:DNA-binding transcriptional ArsR family regulator